MEQSKSQSNFTPLAFLASLGAGGVAVMPFVLMQYTTTHGPGLVTRADIWSKGLVGWNFFYQYFLEAVMMGFTGLHLVLTVYFIKKLISWFRSGRFRELLNDPLSNTALLPPLISLLMTMNVFIGPVRYFFPLMSNNFQSLFLPAMIFWSLLFVFVMFTEIKLLGISFSKGFDIKKINFGWLLHPFLLGMLTVVGTGIAAMSHNASIANWAAFMSLISGSMGVFLLVVKMITVFQSHFASTGLPEKQFLPSFLIVVPNITLFAISAFRIGHFLEHTHGFELGAYYYLVMGVAFAFEVWYMLFGLSLLWDYFKKDHFRDFYVSQWGFICPLVAFVVLGAFVYKLVLTSPWLYAVFVLTIILTIILYLELLIKHIKCARLGTEKINCLK